MIGQLLVNPALTVKLLGGALAIVLALGVALWWQGRKLDAANVRIGAFQSLFQAAKDSNKEWEALHKAALVRINQCHADLDLIGRQNADALAASKARAEANAAELSKWRARYQTLAAGEECGPLLNTPVCPALREAVP